jgi:hypothetical protein
MKNEKKKRKKYLLDEAFLDIPVEVLGSATCFAETNGGLPSKTHAASSSFHLLGGFEGRSRTSHYLIEIHTKKKRRKKEQQTDE